MLIYKEYLYVALVNKDKDLCNIPNLNIFRARIDFKNLEFENIFKQKNDNKTVGHAPHPRSSSNEFDKQQNHPKFPSRISK